MLPDPTVGYTGGSGRQRLLVRKARDQEPLHPLADELEVDPPTSRGDRRRSVAAFTAATARAAGGSPLRRLPAWLRPLVGRLQRWFGPQGLAFACARVETKAAGTVLHLRHSARAETKTMIPEHVRRPVEPYGLRPEPDEPPLARERSRGGSP